MMRTNSTCSSMRLVVRSPVAPSSAGLAERLRECRPPGAVLPATRRPRWEQAVSHHIEIGQREERKGPRCVLRQPAVAYFGKAPQSLHDVEGMLAPRPDARARAIDGHPPRAQLGLLGPAALHPEAHPTPPERLAQSLAPAHSIA